MREMIGNSKDILQESYIFIIGSTIWQFLWKMSELRTFKEKKVNKL